MIKLGVSDDEFDCMVERLRQYRVSDFLFDFYLLMVSERIVKYCHEVQKKDETMEFERVECDIRYLNSRETRDMVSWTSQYRIEKEVVDRKLDLFREQKQNKVGERETFIKGVQKKIDVRNVEYERQVDGIKNDFYNYCKDKHVTYGILEHIDTKKILDSRSTLGGSNNIFMKMIFDVGYIILSTLSYVYPVAGGISLVIMGLTRLLTQFVDTTKYPPDYVIGYNKSYYMYETSDDPMMGRISRPIRSEIYPLRFSLSESEEQVKICAERLENCASEFKKWETECTEETNSEWGRIGGAIQNLDVDISYTHTIQNELAKGEVYYAQYVLGGLDLLLNMSCTEVLHFENKKKDLEVKHNISDAERVCLNDKYRTLIRDYKVSDPQLGSGVENDSIIERVANGYLDEKKMRQNDLDDRLYLNDKVRIELLQNISEMRLHIEEINGDRVACIYNCLLLKDEESKETNKLFVIQKLKYLFRRLQSNICTVCD
ncbi:unnamed protein product [Phytomonas sp. Hart1]|nr:unnamed protein product [Phytomonas sp. Hart1]|eukprot:CCW72205.1 unnamed protein product [Phytomonas sp. isolate Hart1]